MNLGIQLPMVQMVGNKNRTTMKKFKFIYALLAATLFVTACSDEELINEGRVPAADGSEIIFGGRAGFENNDPKGRTIYTGEVYTYDSKDFERIDWITGDKIEIYSEDTSNGSSAHYSITNIAAEENIKTGNYGFLERQGESALQWNGDGNHTFYAMYPSTSMFVREDGTIPTVEQGIKLGKSGNNIVVNGTVPTSQSGTVTEYPEKSGNYIITPNMNYAYMVAKTTAKRQEGQYVGLSFVPIVTAVENEMIVPDNPEQDDIHPVSIAEIQVTGKGIAGDFTADLTSWTGGYPTCANVGDGQGTIQISTWKDNKPITLTEGKSVKFTVFMRPGADYNNLTVSYSPTGSGYVSKNLFGTVVDNEGNTSEYNVNIPRNLKTRIKNLHLPATYDEETQIVVDASRWMDQLADEVEFKALSIPGTGGTFSYNYDGENTDWYKQQTLTLDEQWKLGIRAFEIVSDRPSDGTTSLGTENVKCNKVSMGINVAAVLESLLTRVATPNADGDVTETAVLILTYQPEGASPNRNGASYAESLKLLYNSLSDEKKNQIIQYTPELTLGEARGNVMIFCRLNQFDETDNGDTDEFTGYQLAEKTLAGTNITLINGCGTAKDRWGSRGYTIDGNKAYDIAHVSDASKSVDYYLTRPYRGSFPDWTKVIKPNAENGDLKFGFSTNTGYTCWYQEWARVVPSSIIDQSTGYYLADIQGSLIDWFPSDYRWYESYSEKLAAANKTFDMAISGEYPNYIFINSLCGYYVNPSIEASRKVFTGDWTLATVGGGAGDIKPLSDDINKDFYQHVLTSGFEQTTGPTGIVMMDYAKSTPESDSDGGCFLPGVIISNNFKGNLQTKPDGGTSGGGNTGGNTGGGSGSGDAEDDGGEA